MASKVDRIPIDWIDGPHAVGSSSLTGINRGTNRRKSVTKTGIMFSYRQSIPAGRWQVTCVQTKIKVGSSLLATHSPLK